MTTTTKTETSTGQTRLESLATFTFWTWNMIFLAFMFGGFLPVIVIDLFRSVRSGFVPPVYLLYLFILTAVPILTVTLALTALRGSTLKLFGLGYVVEGPLMLLLLFRFFAVRQSTPVITVLMATAGLGMLAYLWHLLPRLSEGNAAGRWLRLAGLGLLAGVVLYAAAMLVFYVPPLVVFLARMIAGIPLNLIEFFRSFRPESLAWIVYIVFGFILVIFSGTLIVGMPVSAPWLALKAWFARFKEFRRERGALPAASTLLPLAAAVVLVAFAMRQPQRQVYDWLKDPPATSQQAQALLEKSGEIRSGLLNAYLASYRYFSAEGEVSHIRNIYEGAFKLKSGRGYPVQQAFEFIARPLLYKPFRAPDPLALSDNRAFAGDQQEAGALYKAFFDADITRAERAEMVRAARATYSGQQAEADWLAVDDREIALKRQEVTVKEHGDWAEVELYEVYQNRTVRQQEVVYYFSLPESAVITSLYLGNSADRAARFPYRVAPRGAAQAVYRNEIRVRMDPALVEQIGPRQYRLRVFPVQPVLSGNTTARRDPNVENAPQLHLWLTYQTLAANHAWPLPRLAEKRNVYWDGDSVRLVNGQPSTAGDKDWLPESVPASGPVTPTEHRVTFPGGETVVARPASLAGAPALPDGVKLAVVLDRSRSMSERAGQVTQALARIRQAAGEQVEVYLTSSPYRGEAASRVALAQLDPDKVLYYGGQNAGELLSQFQQLQGSAQYDAVLVLTDGTGYEAGQSDIEVSVPDSPLWVVHVDGQFPLGYDDPTLDAINGSGGGVTGSVDEALQRIAAALDGQAEVIDGYVWRLETEGAPAAQPDGFGALAARRLVLTELQSRPGQAIALDTLDRMQALAKENSIVTPFSSMIVLVEERQRQLLDQMEKQNDRFDREVEQAGETAPLGMIAGVPEPEEWLLIGLAALLLAYVWWSRRKKAEARVRA